jgi:hypothetical protein
MNREEFIKHCNLSGTGIEIGVQSGNYARKILEYSNLHLILLDAWRHIEGYPDKANVSTDHHLMLMNNTLKHLIPEFENRFTLIREFSEKAATFFPDNFFDFIYLDADHSEKFVYAELHRWWPKLKQGGLIAGHDYVNLKDEYNDFGVKTAVDNFFGEKNIPVSVVDIQFPTWYVYK